MQGAGLLPGGDPARLAAEVADRALRLGWSVAAAESLTNGALASVLGAAPLASEWFRGSVVACATGVTVDLLGVSEDPVVSAGAAITMAQEAARLLGADLGVALTGVGGPEPDDGQPPGTVWYGVVWPHGKSVEERWFPGAVPEVIDAATVHALHLLRRRLREQ